VLSRTAKQEKQIETKAIKKGLQRKLKLAAAPLQARIKTLKGRVKKQEKDMRKVVGKTKTLVRRAKKHQILVDAKLVSKAEVAGAEAKNILDELKGQITSGGGRLKESNLEADNRIEGHVVFPPGVEHRNALGYVKLKRSDGSLAQTGVVSGSGSFSLHGVEPGTYTAESALRGFETQQELVHIKEGRKMSIHLNSPLLGADSQINARAPVQEGNAVQANGQIFGAVSYRDQNGGEREGVVPALGYVKLHDLGKHHSKLRQMAIVQSGTFKLSNIPSGAYTVETIMPGHPSRFHNVVVDETSQSPQHLEVVV